MPAISSPNSVADAMTRRPVRMAKWLVSGPPLVYLVVFFAIPALIMVLASFRTPGEFGGLAPLLDEAGKLDVNLDSYRRFVTGVAAAASSLRLSGIGIR